MQVMGAPWNKKPSPSPKVLLQPWVAASNVPNLRTSGEVHFLFATAAIDTLQQGVGG